MKKLLLSMFCSLMIGVTCFAPLTVSAYSYKYTINDVSYNYEYSYVANNNFAISKSINSTGTTASDSCMTDVCSFRNVNGSDVMFQITMPISLKNYNYSYFEFELNNVNVDSLSIKLSGNFIEYKIVNNKIIFEVRNFKNNLFIINFTNIKAVDSSNKNFELNPNIIKIYHADSENELEEMISPPLERFLNNVGNIFNECMNWIDSLIEIIVTTPILLLTTGFLCLGAAVGLFVRFIYKD